MKTNRDDIYVNVCLFTMLISLLFDCISLN